MQEALAIAALVVLMLIIVYWRHRQASASTTSVFAEGSIASLPCASPIITSASFGPTVASQSCPTADVTGAVRRLAGSPIAVNAATLGVSTPCSEPRQLTVAFTCPAESSGESTASISYGASTAEHFIGGRAPRESPYAQGAPLAEDVWSTATGLINPTRRTATHAESRRVPHRVLEGGGRDLIEETNLEAIGVYLPGTTHGPKREPGWAVRPGHRRTSWIGQKHRALSVA